MVTNVLLTGVGGQGIITASGVLCQACRLAGWQVKKSEVHGMSQRGGSVESFVRFSPDEPVFSPLIPEGCADFLLAFEPLEALRQIEQVQADGVVLVEERMLPPVTVSTGPWQYPEDAIERIEATGRTVKIIPAFERAEAMGEPRAANTVLLGALAALLDLPVEAWEQAFAEVLKPKALDVNLKAFADGRAMT